MSSEPVIKLEGAGKAYALFSRPEDRLKQMIFGRNRTFYQEFWALQPTDLEILPGETWGIIGRNGSGKSTMLQMICGNLAPTTGRIMVSGKVAALLELGAGFNPEFTGRENVYVNGALAGYEHDEVDARMDAILSFADIGEFVDQPVKNYSSGMFARLAFAVAINVDPDILVVDEALAVGDAKFQLKCFRRLEELKTNGTTILFVSHATEQIKALCDSALVLDRGRTVFSGDAKTAVVKYHEILFPEQLPKASATAGCQFAEAADAHLDAECTTDVEPRRATAAKMATSNASTAACDVEVVLDDADPGLVVDLSATDISTFGIGGAAISSFAIKGLDRPNLLVGGRKISVIAEYRWDKQFVQKIAQEQGYEPDISFGVALANSKGNYIFGGNSFDCKLRIDCRTAERAQILVTFTLPHLAEGTYFLTTAIALGTQANHVQLKWYDCFLELQYQRTDRNVFGVLALDYAMTRLTEARNE